ncbi:MAG: hypothetical protein CMP36_01325 [Rickettsiales bacterium]|nr:hypothetical protein [Rickettsiales bacterium]OUV82155.1 MAG: hypothetical protein CBC91_01765 [Rickettsiales bacterium TMED131]|tara:strand:- start:1710 stop:2267 length:558 start_codon:yes stop_codon:yes gene_type:complete
MRKVILYFLVLNIFLILVGFVYFYKKIEYKETSFIESTDGIAVLTGGKGRIKQGLDLINLYKNKKLIISGVHKKVSMGTIIPNRLTNKNNITLDKVSESTFENVLVISEWIKENNLINITIITSYYHMPRTMLLMKAIAPEYNYYAYPVKKKIYKKYSLKNIIFYYFFIVEEYVKYLLSHIIIIV